MYVRFYEYCGFLKLDSGEKISSQNGEDLHRPCYLHDLKQIYPATSGRGEKLILFMRGTEVEVYTFLL